VIERVAVALLLFGYCAILYGVSEWTQMPRVVYSIGAGVAAIATAVAISAPAIVDEYRAIRMGNAE